MTQVYALTPWFPGSVKPKRPGVYQRRTPAAEWLRTRGKKGWGTTEELASEIERGL